MDWSRNGGAGSNLNIYLSCDTQMAAGTAAQTDSSAGFAQCEGAGYGSASHVPGTIVRFNLLDTGTENLDQYSNTETSAENCPATATGAAPAPALDVVRAHWAMFDVNLHDAGTFARLGDWVNLQLVVTPSKVAVYVDGEAQDRFCFFAPTAGVGLSSNMMALITLDCGTICSPSIKWP